MTSHRTKARRALATAIGIAALTAAASGGGVLAAQAAPSFTAPTYDMTIGGPGHAFVYPWGMVWDPTTDTILTSDYNNYDVKRFSPSGAWLDTYNIKPYLQGQQPYTLAVDPNTGDFVVSIATSYDRFSSNGTFIHNVNTEADGGFYVPYLAINPTNGWVYVVSSDSSFTPSAVLMFNSSDVYQGDLTTTAGQAVPNGTSCTDPEFGYLRGIDVDDSGNVYVDDMSNHCVQEFSSTGVYEDSFSTKGQTSSNTRDLAVDSTNHLVYITDSAKQDVEVYNIATGSGYGKFEGLIGTPGSTVGNSCGGGGELDGPRGIAVGSGGTIYVADYTCFGIDAFNPLFDTSDPGGFVLTMPDPAIAPPAGGLNDAIGVAVSPVDDTVYVSDTFNQRVQEFDGPMSPGGTPGAFVQMWGSRLPGQSDYCAMDYPRAVAVDPAGNLWLDDTRSGWIKAYTADGNANGPLGCAIPSTGTVSSLTEFGGEGIDLECGSITCDPGEFFYSRGIFVGGPNDDVYVGDSGNLRLQVLTQTGAELPGFPVACGTADGLPTIKYSGCAGVTVDSAGNIYAASPNQGVVDVFNSSGTLVTTFGSGTLKAPFGVAMSPDHSILYVTDVTKNRVSEFSLSSTAYGDYLGSFGQEGSAHGDFNQPEGIAVDAYGNIFVNDYSNQRIEVFTPATS
jgi:sugar lactone lactonase YvrE